VTNPKLRVLGIAGSPRCGGNTDLLLEQALAGAVTAGAQTNRINSRELNIAPCFHCDKCLPEGKCATDDDMQWLYQELLQADHLILSAPIFFLGLPAQVKAMIDRCQALWVRKYLLKVTPAITTQGKRRGLYLSVAGNARPNTFQPSIATVKAWFATLDIEYSAELFFAGMDTRDAIIAHPTALRDAFLAGEKLVQG
jgi:multimeric flavodoxin WrbA